MLEVETPILSRAGNSDPGMCQFSTHGGHWLRTSPEYALKRLLARHPVDVFELGRVFRSGEAGRRHNPEFTLLEWYRLGWSYPRLMEEVAALVEHCGKPLGKTWTVRSTTYRDWLRDTVGIDPLEDPLDRIIATVQAADPALRKLDGLDRDGWLDLAVTHLAQPALPRDELTLVSLYPASQAALARLHPEDPRVAERFEVFVGDMELANGYRELTDATEQCARFERENDRRRRDGLPEVPLDHHLLQALEAGLPECSGVALGVDRLLMALGGHGHLDEVVAFPGDRA